MSLGQEILFEIQFERQNYTFSFTKNISPTDSVFVKKHASPVVNVCKVPCAFW